MQSRANKTIKYARWFRHCKQIRRQRLRWANCCCSLRRRRSTQYTDAITNSTEDRTAVAILKQFQPAVLQRPTITNSAIERTSVESDFRHIVVKDAERLW